MNDEDLDQRVGGATLTGRRKRANPSKAPRLLKRFEGPDFDVVLRGAPALSDMFPEPRPDYAGCKKIAGAESKAQDDWEESLAARVRAGEVSIETAIQAVSCYAAKVARTQWVREARQ
jgi:hypothetical protein